MKLTNIYDTVLKHDPLSSGHRVQLNSPIATLVQCHKHLFLCIGEVNDITVNSHHVDQISIDYLMEPSVFVSYQMLLLVPASIEDDPDLKNDWHWSGRRGTTHNVVGQLVKPINPSISTR